MAKKSNRDDEPVKIDRLVAYMGRIVATFENVQLAELMSETLRPAFIARLKAHKIEIPTKVPKNRDEK